MENILTETVRLYYITLPFAKRWVSHQSNHLPSPALTPVSYMVDPSTRSLVRAVRASLRLANHSAVRLSTSELLAIRAGLQETLVCIDGQIRENQTLAAGEFIRDV